MGWALPIERLYGFIGEQGRGYDPAGMALQAAVLRELESIVGGQHVVHDPFDLRIFERDASIAGFLPDAVVLPADRDQAVGVIALAARRGIPVVPRGAGTGLSGGA